MGGDGAAEALGGEDGVGGGGGGGCWFAGAGACEAVGWVEC